MPEPDTLGSDDGHDKFVEFVVTARPTEPANPFSDAAEIVELPRIPTMTVTFSGLAVKTKSGDTEFETTIPPTLADG